MRKSNLVPIIRKRGWGLAMLNPITKEPVMYLEKRTKMFNGLLTIESIFDEESEVIHEYKKYNKSQMPFNIVEIEHTYSNGNVSIQILREL